MSPGHVRVQDRKAQIVDCVLDLVAAHGVEAVSAQRIADAVGISQPAVFKHFPTKEAIWLAVMDWLEEQLLAVHAAATQSASGNGLKTLRLIFVGHVQLIERYPALAKLVLSDQLRLQHPSLQARFRAIHQAYVARLRAAIEAAVAAGALPIEVSTEDAAAMFLALLQGLGFQYAIAKVSDDFRRNARTFLAMFLQGLAAPSGVRALVEEGIDGDGE